MAVMNGSVMITSESFLILGSYTNNEWIYPNKHNLLDIDGDHKVCPNIFFEVIDIFKQI